MVMIRDAALSDVRAICVLGENVTEFATSSQTVTFWPEDILRASIGQTTVIILVATHNDAVVGFIIAGCNKPLSKVLIENIYVHPDMRGQGIGTKLIQAVIQRAKDQSYEFISVLTPPGDTAAIKAYQKTGFIKGTVFLWLDLIINEKFKA